MPRDEETGKALIPPDSLRPDADPAVVHAECMAPGGLDLASAFHAHLALHCQGKTGKALCPVRGHTAQGLCPVGFTVCPHGARAAKPLPLADVLYTADEAAALALKANPVPAAPGRKGKGD